MPLKSFLSSHFWETESLSLWNVGIDRSLSVDFRSPASLTTCTTSGGVFRSHRTSFLLEGLHPEISHGDDQSRTSDGVPVRTLHSFLAGQHACVLPGTSIISQGSQSATCSTFSGPCLLFFPWLILTCIFSLVISPCNHEHNSSQ